MKSLGHNISISVCLSKIVYLSEKKKKEKSLPGFSELALPGQPFLSDFCPLVVPGWTAVSEVQIRSQMIFLQYLNIFPRHHILKQTYH